MSGKKFEIQTVFKGVDKTSRVMGKIQSKIVGMSAKASMAFRKLDRLASRTASRVTAGFKYGALGIAAGATAVFMAINKTAESMDALAKKTRAMQFPIEAYQEFQFASQQSGVTTEVFDKSLQKFTKTVGELKGGYGAMYTALKKTNPALLRELKTTDSVEVAFSKYLQAIEKTPGPMKKAALATAGFGRSGMDMINLANAGTEEIKKLRGEMRENGVVTEAQAKQAEAYNDMMNRLNKTFRSFAVEALTPLMPMLKDGADYTRKWLVENKALIKTKVTEFIKKIPVYLEKIAYWGPKIAKGIAVFYGLTAAIKITSGVLTVFNTLMKINLGPAKKAARFFAKDMPMSIGKSVGAAGALKTSFGVLGAAVAGAGIGLAIHEHIIDPLMKAQMELEDLVNEVSDTIKRDKSKRSTAQLKKDLSAVKKVQKGMDEGLTGAVFNYLPDLTGAVGAFRKMAESGIQLEKGNIKAELEQRSIAAEFDVTDTSSGPVTPVAATSRSEQVVKHEVEMTIKDDAGRTRVKSGKTGPGFRLQHTGAAY